MNVKQAAIATALGLASSLTLAADDLAGKPTVESATQIVASWPKDAKHTATQMIVKYGAPAEATPTQLTWLNNGPWKRTVVQKEEIDHAFPMPHKDVMLQVVDYEVPEDKVDEFVQYDGSVYVDRTRGELAARCDMEAANLLALNLADEIATGKRSVADAREFYPKAVMAHLEKKPTPYTQKLLFSSKRGADPDKTTVAPDMLKKAMELKKAMIAEEKAKAGEKSASAGGS
jgi:hypothetical protein